MSEIAQKKFRDLTPAEKQKRYDYQKKRRQKLSAEMRKAGIIGQPRPKMTEEERKSKRKGYSKNYRHKTSAEAKAWRELQKQQEAEPKSHKIARRKSS